LGFAHAVNVDRTPTGPDWIPFGRLVSMDQVGRRGGGGGGGGGIFFEGCTGSKGLA
jgi:hypothetical protein